MSPDPLEGTLNIHLDLVLVNNDPGNLFYSLVCGESSGGGQSPEPNFAIPCTVQF